MEITLPPKNDLSERIVLQNPHNIVIIGANGAGKSRFGEEIEREIHPVDRVFDITNAQVELDARKANGYGY